MSSNSSTRDDLYCPECAGKGMRALYRKAESGRTRYKCMSCGFRTTTTLYTAPQLLPRTRVTDIKKHKRFIITSAVNDTDIVSGAHNTFKRMAKELGACYLVIPGVYKNPDLKHQGVINNYSWPDEILPYVCNADIDINKYLVIRALTRIQYTAINPLAGMNHAGDIRSEIFAHPQVAMQMVPTAKHSPSKMLHTTGTISVKNYGGSKTAKKAEFHHSIGALFIEVEGDKFWTTQLSYDGTGVYLFDRYYTHKSSRKSKGVEAIVFGDIHIRSLDNTTNKLLNDIRSSLKPKNEIYHDLHDHHLGSHHNEGNTIFNLKKAFDDEFCIKKELMKSVRFLDDKPNAVIIDSNHHKHLEKWFNRFRPNRGGVNLKLYFELSELLMKDLENGGDGDLFKLFLEKYCKHELTFVNGNDSYNILDIDCSQHGDRGPNGSRGSIRVFAKTGQKTIVGHSHTPGIEKLCWQVGTSNEDLDYAIGYSSWMKTHGVIYPNGERGLISIVKNKLSPMMREINA